MAEAFGIVGAAGAALLLLANRRVVLLAGIALLAVGELGLAAAATDGARRISPALAVVALAAAIVLGAAIAVLVRAPELVTPLILFAAPFRLPLDFGSEHRFYVGTARSGELGRLLPLYVALAAALGALAWSTLRGAPVVRVPLFVAVPAAAFVGFAALSLLWTQDENAGRQLLEFFLLPFATLVAVVARARFARWLPRALCVIAVGIATLLALLALWQAATHKLLFYTPVLEVANRYTPYFRVTSLFRDPSLYGRHVVLGIVVLVVVLWRRRIRLLPAAALIAVLWLGLLFSYSQSSFAALFVAALAVTLVAAAGRARRIVAIGAAAILLAGAFATGASAIHHSSRKATSDRSRRIELTVRAWWRQPVQGVGLGAQPSASQALAKRGGPRPLFASHTTPLTVLAELGLVGFALYVAFLVASARLFLLVYRRLPGLGLALAGVVLALFVHSLAYSGFLEDPITWFALGVGAAALAAPVLPVPRRRAAPVERAEPVEAV